MTEVANTTLCKMKKKEQSIAHMSDSSAALSERQEAVAAASVGVKHDLCMENAQLALNTSRCGGADACPCIV